MFARIFSAKAPVYTNDAQAVRKAAEEKLARYRATHTPAEHFLALAADEKREPKAFAA